LEKFERQKWGNLERRPQNVIIYETGNRMDFRTMDWNLAHVVGHGYYYTHQASSLRSDVEGPRGDEREDK
jgi:hypothetical protein